jgi:hypothetical protein
MRMLHSTARKAVAGLVSGTVLVGTAWAGVGLAPVGDGGQDGPATAPASAAAEAAAHAVAADTSTGLTPPDLSGLTAELPDGEFLVGADVGSLAPDPSRWQTEGCVRMENQTYAEAAIDHLHGLSEAQLVTGWPKSPDCVYMGGYGLPGPARPATGVDPHAGVNVRSVAISNGKDTVVWQMVDMVALFNKYRDDLCDRCGILDIRRAIEAGTNGKVPASNVAIGSTHTHGGADGYGIWGGLPSWYRTQLRDAVVASAYDALRAMRPATIAIGSVDARAFNNERRDFYYSTADYGAVWLHARSLPTKKNPKKDSTEPIATLVNYAAHPVVLGAGNTLLHGDWPATAAKALEESGGGTGLIFEGGLGNVSPSRPTSGNTDLTGDGTYDHYDKVIEMGRDFAGYVTADITRGGSGLVDNDVMAADVTIEHPVTNWAEAGLGVATLLDRPFLPDDDAAGPAGRYQFAKNTPTRSCTTAGPFTVKTQVSGYRIGDLTVLTGPGELFSNMSEVVKSKARRNALGGGQTMVFGQTQDSLGYIIQSFEVDPLGGPAQYVPESQGEYEETFMLDRCFGDHVLETQLGLIGGLR